jgi:hypothetical protein
MSLRPIIDPTAGTEIGASVRATMLSKQSFVMCNLYSFSNRAFWIFNPFNYCALWTFTDADWPISLDYVQLTSQAFGATLLSGINSPGGVNRLFWINGNTSSTSVMFLPHAIGASNDGGFKHSALTYEVGLAAHDVDVTWFVDDRFDYFAMFGPYSGGTPINPPNTTPPILSMKQVMSYYRAFDDCPFWIHRAFFSDFPKNGGSLLGTTLMWRGFIRKTEAAPDYLKISLGSLMQIAQDTPLPSQLIQPNARSAPFVPNPNGSGGVFGTPIVRVSAKTYTVKALTTLLANQLQDCWVTFWGSAGSVNYAPQSGVPPFTTPVFRLQSNTAASSGSNMTITFYDPPIIPGSPSGIGVFSPNTENVGAPGFPFLPPPETSL